MNLAASRYNGGDRGYDREAPPYGRTAEAPPPGERSPPGGGAYDRGAEAPERYPRGGSAAVGPERCAEPTSPSHGCVKNTVGLLTLEDAIVV